MTMIEMQGWKIKQTERNLLERIEILEKNLQRVKSILLKKNKTGSVNSCGEVQGIGPRIDIDCALFEEQKDVLKMLEGKR